jgi:hypothetical protein
VIDPSQLPGCGCAGAHCLPSQYVPTADQSKLNTCGSGATAGYCTPDVLIQTAGDFQPPTCAPFDGQGTGRCLSNCIPQVQQQASQLQQTTCGSGNLCAPCWDPFTGVATGACSLSSCDSAPPTPYTFPGCCGGSNPPATCVPTFDVPANQQGSLNQDVCPAQFLCVPDEYLPAPHTSGSIQTCSNLIIFPGACVNTCAVNVPASFIFGQNGCPANHLCVNCALGSLFGSKPPGC